MRTFAVGSEAEGCVADDDAGCALHQRGERGALALLCRADGGSARTAVDAASAGGELTDDIEGVTLVDQPDGKGFLIVSAQNAVNPNASYFSVYRREGTNAFVKTFRIVNGPARTTASAPTASPPGPPTSACIPARRVRLPGQQQQRPRGSATRTSSW